jgi:RsiW-degrading membrane proteinase PrsW (M82 family)
MVARRKSNQRPGFTVVSITMSPVLRVAALALVALSLALLVIDAPGPTWRELWFLGLILLGTLITRSMRVSAALSALGLGLGVVTMMMVGTGHLLAAAGLDTTTGIGNWGVIPLLEETLKLVPVAIVAWIYQRRSGLTPNPSDLLMLGCFAGAGFALAENALLVRDSAAIARDMARQYGPHIGPFYLVPGAWGAAGYVGHAAATGMVAATLGLGLALRRRIGPTWWIIPAAGFAWIVLEHALTNYYVGSGSQLALALGNGRLTPWLFVGVAITNFVLDSLRGAAVLRHSPILLRRTRMILAAFVRRTPPQMRSRFAARQLLGLQLRTVNATAWFLRDDPRLAGRRSS